MAKMLGFDETSLEVSIVIKGCERDEPSKPYWSSFFFFIDEPPEPVG
jgi:hypothetical protein